MQFSANCAPKEQQRGAPKISSKSAQWGDIFPRFIGQKNIIKLTVVVVLLTAVLLLHFCIVQLLAGNAKDESHAEQSIIFAF